MSLCKGIVICPGAALCARKKWGWESFSLWTSIFKMWFLKIGGMTPLEHEIQNGP